MKKSIEENLNRWMGKICDYSNQSSKKWSRKKLKTYWFFFVLGGMAISLEIGVRALQYAKPLEGISRPQITAPYKPAIHPNLNREWFSVLLSRVKAYQSYLDSLSLIDTTRYRAILKSQPFLLDSLHAMETFLIKNIKK